MPQENPPVADPKTQQSPVPSAEAGAGNNQPAQQDDGVHDALMANILSSLRPDQEPAIQPAPSADAGTGQPNPPVESAPIPETPATPTAPAPAPAPAQLPVPASAPAAQRKVVKSVAKGHPVVESPAAPPAPAPLPTPPAAPVPASDPADSFTDEQRDELAEAAVAEKLFGDRYKGRTAALKKWFQDFDGRANALRTQNPNVTEDDDEYQALLASKPAIKPGDYKKVVKTMATEAAVQETNQRLAPKLDTLEMTARRAEILPGVQNFTNTVFPQGIRALIQADPQSPLHEPLKLAMEKGIDAACEEYPEESTIIREATEAQQRRVQEFLLLKNRATVYDAKNAVHREIADIINQEGRQLVDYSKKNGGQHLSRDGRVFMPREEFIAMLGSDKAESQTFNPAQWTTQRYWTFTDTAIVDIMALRTKNEAEQRIKFERDRAGKLGYVKAPKKIVANPQPPKPAEAIVPPKAIPSAAPGAQRPVRPPLTDDSPIPVASVVANLKMTK